MAGTKRRSNGQGGYAPEKLGMRPATKDHLTSQKKPFRVWHPIVTDNALSVALEAARKAYDEANVKFQAARARHLNYPANKEAEAEMNDALAALAEAIEVHDEAREAAAEATVYVTMKAPALHKVEEARRAHPLTDKEREELAEAQVPEENWPKFSQNTIGPAMISLALVEPAMTEEEVREGIWENPDIWNETEKSALLTAAYSTYSRGTVDLGKVSGPIRSSEPSKGTSTATPSPEASS